MASSGSKVIYELKTRGITDILIAVVDGLKVFPEAIGTVFPLTIVQTCIVAQRPTCPPPTRAVWPIDLVCKTPNRRSLRESGNPNGLLAFDFTLRQKRAKTRNAPSLPAASRVARR